MKQIIEGSQLIGKTITAIKYANNNGNLVLFFDKEYAVYSSESDRDGVTELYLDGFVLNDYDKRELDIITENEWQAIRNEKHEAIKIEKEKRERAQLAELLKKYK